MKVKEWMAMTGAICKTTDITEQLLESEMTDEMIKQIEDSIYSQVRAGQIISQEITPDSLDRLFEQVKASEEKKFGYGQTIVVYTEQEKEYMKNLYPQANILVLPQQCIFEDGDSKNYYIFPNPDIKPLKVCFENK